MSAADSEDTQPIIIVRRKAGGGDGHHGGAWKIAFADFMTAMMALFLVLWLINAANEETKKAVASYFNPVKLVDRNRSEKGLNNSDGAVEAETNFFFSKARRERSGPARSTWFSGSREGGSRAGSSKSSPRRPRRRRGRYSGRL